MPYPQASDADVEFFQEHGWLVVADAIDSVELSELGERCEVILQKKHTLAFDWAWEKGKEKHERDFKIVQSSASMVWPEIARTRFRRWMVAFASALMQRDVEFWYDQYLAKPPRDGAPTYWHQDEGYWGRNLLDKGITCWIPLIDVDAENGCMHFIDHGHRDGVLTHHSVEGLKSDLLTCDPDESRMVVCPIKRGSVTFHHSKMPHMTTANNSTKWRKAVSNHMQETGAGGEGDHYPWKFYVNQHTGKVTVPPSR